MWRFQLELELELILEYFWKIQLIIPTKNYFMALYRVFEFRSWHRPKLEHTRKALLTRILCWRLCSYDLKPGLPIDVFALYSTLFITMINHSTTHSCVCVEWVGCGTNAEHTWFWTFDYTNRCWTPALLTWCGQTHSWYSIHTQICRISLLPLFILDSRNYLPLSAFLSARKSEQWLL